MHGAPGFGCVSSGLDVVGRPPFVWHPTSTTAQILAIGDGMRIYVIDVPAAAAAAEESQIECHASATQLPTAVRCIQCPELVTALAFSTDGGKLAAATARNEVRPACLFMLGHTCMLSVCKCTVDECSTPISPSVPPFPAVNLHLGQMWKS